MQICLTTVLPFTWMPGVSTITLDIFYMFIVRALREDQPLRLLLNSLFYHFNRSEPTYKSQRIKLLDVVLRVIN